MRSRTASLLGPPPAARDASAVLTLPCRCSATAPASFPPDPPPFRLLASCRLPPPHATLYATPIQRHGQMPLQPFRRRPPPPPSRKKATVQGVIIPLRISTTSNV